MIRCAIGHSYNHRVSDDDVPLSPSRKQRTYKTATQRQGLGISNVIEENHVGGARAL